MTILDEQAREALDEFAGSAFDAIDQLQVQVRELRAELEEKDAELEALRRAVNHIDCIGEEWA